MSKEKTSKRSFPGSLMILLNIIFGAGLIMSYAAAYISPAGQKDWWQSGHGGGLEQLTGQSWPGGRNNTVTYISWLEIPR